MGLQFLHKNKLRSEMFNGKSLKTLYFSWAVGLAWTVFRCKKQLGKERAVVFLRGVNTPIHTKLQALLFDSFPHLLVYGCFNSLKVSP